MRRLVPLLLAAAGLVAASARADFRLFDMGPKDSPVWRGAELVTEATLYTPQTGFGWRKSDNLKAVKRPIPDDLGSDFVEGPGVFVLDAPEGEYRVWVLLCDSGQGINVPRFWVEPSSIQVNGREVVKVEPTPETFFRDYWWRNWKADWAPGQSLFDKYFAQYDRPYELAAKPADGRIELAFSWRCPVAAVAVWPMGEDAAGKAALAAVNAARRQQFDAAWQQAPLPTNLKPATYSKQDRDRGYAVWPRTCGETVFPYTEPEPYERTRRLEALACLDEYEPLSLCVRPLEDLQEATVTVSPLLGAKGSALGPDQVRTSIVKYVEVGGGAGKYEVRPRELLPAEPRRLTQNVTKQYWITVHVPAETPPGEYRGTVTVQAQERPAASLPLTLTVLPVRLGSPGRQTGMYYYMPEGTDFRPYRGSEVAGPLAELTRKQLRDLREHGMTTVAADPPWYLIQPQGDQLAYNEPAWQELDAFYGLYKEAGFTAPLPAYSLGFVLMMALPNWPSLEGEKAWQRGQPFDPEFRRRYAESVRMFYARARSHQQAGEWPEVIYYASDELSNDGTRGAEWGLQHLHLLNEVKPQVPGGFRTCCSINGPPERIMVPALDIAIPNNGFPVNPETLGLIGKAGAELWFYNLGMDRFTWGYFPVKCGAKGRLQWHYHCNPSGTCDPHNWLTSSTYGVTMGPDGPLANVEWEMVREGIDDGRLVTALQSLIAEARKRGVGKAACDQAEGDLKWLLDSINPDLGVYANETGYWDASVYGKLKAMLGRDAVAVQQALAKGR